MPFEQDDKRSAFAKAKENKEKELEKTRLETESALHNKQPSAYAKTHGQTAFAQLNLEKNLEKDGAPLKPKKSKKNKRPLTPEEIQRRENARIAAQKVGKGTFFVTKHTIGLIFSTLLSIFMIIVLTGTIVCTALTVWVMEFAGDADEVTIKGFEEKFDTVIYAINPQFDEALPPSETNLQYLSVYEVKNSIMRIPVTIDQVPQHVSNAFVCVEDERFYMHDGVDYKRTFAAFANMFLHFYDTDQGGSTLTQQLIKNITGDNDVSMQRKIREIFRAMKFEKTYSKDEILEAYINSVEFGGGAIGIEYASKKYFGKTVGDLSIAEAACLAGIPQNPEVINPFSSEKRNRERMEHVLERMYVNGAISYDEYQAALNEKLIFANSAEYKAAHPELNNKVDQGELRVTPWYVDAAIYELQDYFIENEAMTGAEALKHINSGGYKVFLTVDLEMQTYLEGKYKNWDLFPNQVNRDKLVDVIDPLTGKPEVDPVTGENVKEFQKIQSSFVALDYAGGVKAIVGGIGDKNEYGSLCLNRPVQSTRDPGSTIKPVTSYGAAFLNDIAYYSELIEDTPSITLDNGRAWPTNYGGSYSGEMKNIYYCLSRSLNTTPAKFIQALGVNKVYEFATQRMGLELNPRDEAYAPLCIGSMTYGVTLENLVNAYIPYGNGGTYYKAHIISNVLDGTGNLLYSNAGKSKMAVDPDTAYVINKMMQNVVNGEGSTGAAARLSSRVVAGKTGTTDEQADLLFIGLTEDFASGIWFGFDDRYTIDRSRCNAPLLWKKVIEEYTISHPAQRQYPVNENVIAAKHCTVTGKIAGPYCEQSAITCYYKPSNAPVCDGNHDVTNYGENEYGSPDGNGNTFYVPLTPMT